jgi:hypothetical protein
VRLGLGLVGRPSEPKLSLHLPGGPLHGGRLLPSGSRLPQQIPAHFVVEAVEKQKPGGVFGHSRSFWCLPHRPQKEIPGLEEPQFRLGLKPLFIRTTTGFPPSGQRPEAGQPCGGDEPSGYVVDGGASETSS